MPFIVQVYSLSFSTSVSILTSLIDFSCLNAFNIANKSVGGSMLALFLILEEMPVLFPH